MTAHDLLTPAQAAALLQVTVPTVYRMVKSGALDGVIRFGPKTIRIPRSSIVPVDYASERRENEQRHPPFGLPPSGAATRLNHALLRAGYESREDLTHVSDTEISDLRGVGEGLLAMAIDHLPIITHYYEIDGVWRDMVGREVSE